MIPLDSFSGGNDAQSFRFDSVRSQHNATIDRLDNLLSKGALEPFRGVRVVEIGRRVVDHAVHIAVVNRQHAQPFLLEAQYIPAKRKGGARNKSDGTRGSGTTWRLCAQLLSDCGVEPY